MGELRVAFAGHNRPEDLGDLREIDRQLGEAFTLFGETRGVLVTGLATGSDRHAAAAWASGGRGSIHAVLPHLTDTVPKELAAAVSKTTWLDGAAAELTGRNAHLIQTRWVLEDADVLVAVWTGEPARGAGGTADAVRIALKRGIPVLWVEPRRPGQARWISPEALDPDFGFLEFLEQLRLEQPWLVGPATPEIVAKALQSWASGPAKASSPPKWRQLRIARLWQQLLDRTVWRTFAAYRRLVGGRPVRGRERLRVPDDLLGQPGFATLTAAYEEMDARANHLSAVHRSQQVFQASVMILAVAIGSAPAVWPGLKIYAVTGELVLALATFLVWMSAVRSERTRRWGEARRMAEQLRLERAAWAIGLSTRDDRRFNSTGPAAQLALAWRRRVGGPEGRFDEARVQRWGAWAREELIQGQVAYHRIQGHLNHRLAHRGHSIENMVFWLLVIVLLTYIVAFAWSRHVGGEVPHWLGGMVILTGAITPAFGAASLALDAALAFSEQGRRSDAICGALSAIAEAIGPDASLEALQRAARASIRLQVSQEDNWSDDTTHRHIVRGG